MNPKQEKCLGCGKYVVAGEFSEGYFAPDRPGRTLDDPGVELAIFCDEVCADRFHDMTDPALESEHKRGTEV